MDLHVPETVFDASLEPLLRLDACVPFGEAFSTAVNTRIQGEVALFSAPACPEKLGVDDAGFNALYKDKVVLWLWGAPESCERDYWKWRDWYKRMMDAGAKAVVQFGDPGRTPGVFFTAFTLKSMRTVRGLENVTKKTLIPMLDCALTVPEPASAASSMERYNSFVNARTQDLASRAILTAATAQLGPTNAAVTDIPTLSNSANLTAEIQVSESLWEELMSGVGYQFYFHGVIPMLFFLAVGLGAYFAHERVTLSRNRGLSWRELINIPLVALAIEISTSLVCGIYFAIDGMWDVVDSPVVSMRTTMLFSLTLTSMGSSVLVGLSFSDFRHTSKNLTQFKGTFVENHRFGLAFGGIGLITLEAVSTLMRRSSAAAFTVANLVAMFAGLMVAAWFAYEAWYFSKILQNLASSHTVTNDTSGTDLLRRVLQHTRLWASISSVSLSVVVVIGVVNSLDTDTLWSVSGWPMVMGVMLWFRGIYAISKVVLCRLPKTQRGNTGPSSILVTKNGSLNDMTNHQSPHPGYFNPPGSSDMLDQSSV
jgi:hypothetical protein